MSLCLDDDALGRLWEGAPLTTDQELHLDTCRCCAERLTHVLAESGGADAHEAKRLAVGDRVGRYRIAAQLGAGMAGRVYSAHDAELDREVALKVLRPGAPAHRLLAEARALARLEHPSVVTIFDAGLVDGLPIIAMQRVVGQNLREWLGAQKRTRREILAVFDQAGQGLWAAHQAGLVHRDFKPENVLVDSASRAYVTDFGLAIARHTPGGAAPKGQVAGTPAYMAPEQVAGEAHPASDQYSFCVALYEALHGSRPPMRRGPRRLGRRTRLSRTLQRGLQAKPEDRFPSMQALLDALRRSERRPGPRALAFTTLTLAPLVAVGIGGWLARRPARAPCEARAVISDRDRERIRAAFAASRVRAQEHLLEASLGLLDGQARELGERERALCEEADPQWSRDCIEDLGHELSAVVERLTRADAALVARSVSLSGSLTRLETCAGERTRRDKPLPIDPEVARRVQAVRRSITVARLERQSGRYTESAALAERAVAEAQALGFAPLTAEAHWSLGAALWPQGRPADAKRALEEALFTAEASRHDRLAALALTALVHVVGQQLGRPEEGRALARSARAKLQRLPDRHSDIASSLSLNEGNIARQLGHPDRALELYEEALTLTADREHGSVAGIYNNLAVASAELGRYAQARAWHERALALRRKWLGEDHPETAMSLVNLALLLHLEGRSAEALTMARRALEVRARELGDDHPDLAVPLEVMGAALLDTGARAEGQAHLERALALRERAMGPYHFSLIAPLEELARCALERGRPRTAARLIERAVALAQAGLPPRHPQHVATLTRAAEIALVLGKRALARSQAGRALTLAEELGRPPDEVARARLMLARAGGDVRSIDEPGAQQVGRASPLLIEHRHEESP